MFARLLTRLYLFRRDLVTLWRAFWQPQTPFLFKLVTVLTALYVLSPIDLITDIVPFAGWVDDLLLVTMVVKWVVSRLPQPVHAYAGTDKHDGPTINGTSRRL